VLRIARATRRLSDGFDAIERGDFSHRLKFGGQDQLAGLIESFNRMTSHLGESVDARARQEALELELGLARDLQKRLLPPAGFTFPGVEIAVDFRPAAAIGGDFYHLIAEGDHCLAVVIADVSGHGLPTGIVMASAKASLSSLARTGAETVEMLKSLDEEIRKTTDARTFVTLAYLRFRFDRGFIEYTNAGHIYPYRVSPDGSVTSIENPARPLGLSLHATFRTVETPLVAGDTWVLLSDGIIEAQSASGEVFGFERFEALLARCGGKSAAEVKEVILQEWKAFNGSEEPADDVTLVVLRILEPAST
jgi:sigma-B regulation protein RsbU (phosphoserine phosphatase)